MKLKKFIPLIIFPLVMVSCGSKTSTSSRSDFTYDPATSLVKENVIENISLENNPSLKEEIEKIDLENVSKDELLNFIEKVDLNDLYPSKAKVTETEYNSRPDDQFKFFSKVRTYDLNRDNDKKVVTGTSKYVIESIKADKDVKETKTINGTYTLNYDLDAQTVLDCFDYEDDSYDLKYEGPLSEENYKKRLNIARGNDFISYFKMARSSLNLPNTVFDAANESIKMVKEDNLYILKYDIFGELNNIKCVIDASVSFNDGVITNINTNYKEIDTSASEEVLLKWMGLDRVVEI